MSRVAEMHTLTEDLIRSHEQRMAGIAVRRADSHGARELTRRQMAAQHVARLDAAAALQKELAENAANRLDAAAALQKELAENAANRRDAMASYLAGTSQARAEMSARQRAALARATSDRQAKVQEMRADTRSAVRNTHDARVADEANLHARLARDRTDLSQQVSDFVSGLSRLRAGAAAEQEETLAQGHAKLVFDTASFLSAVHDAREALAKSQSEALANGRAALHAEVATTLGGIHSAREALAANLAEFNQVWQNFATTMQEKRTGAPAAPEAKAKEAKAKASPPAEPAAAPAREPAEAHEQVSAMPSDDTVFRHLADHPDGLRLTELEDHFGVVRIRMANIVNRLIEENKARKDEERKLYFAT